MRRAIHVTGIPFRQFTTSALLHAPKKGKRTPKSGAVSTTTTPPSTQSTEVPPAAPIVPSPPPPSEDVSEVTSQVSKHKEAISALVRRTSKIQEDLADIQAKSRRNNYRLRSAKFVVDQVDTDRRFVRLLARQFLLEVQFVGHRYSVIWERLKVLERELLLRTDPTQPLPLDANAYFPVIPNYGRDTNVVGELPDARRDNHFPGEFVPTPVPAFDVDNTSTESIKSIIVDLKNALTKATASSSVPPPSSAEVPPQLRLHSLRELLEKSIFGDRQKIRRIRRRLDKLSKGDPNDEVQRKAGAYFEEREKELAKREDLVIMLESVMGRLGAGDSEDGALAKHNVDTYFGSADRLLEMVKDATPPQTTKQAGAGATNPPSSTPPTPVVPAPTTPATPQPVDPQTSATLAALTKRLAEQDAIIAKLAERVGSFENRNIMVIHKVEDCREAPTAVDTPPPSSSDVTPPTPQEGGAPVTTPTPTSNLMSMEDFMPSAIERIPKNYLVLHHVPESVTIGSLKASLTFMLSLRKEQFITQYKKRSMDSGRDVVADERRITELVAPPLSIAACSLSTPRSMLPPDDRRHTEEAKIGGKSAFLLYFTSPENAARVQKVLEGNLCHSREDEGQRGFTLHFRLLDKNDYYLW